MTLGAAVIDDILANLLLGIVTAVGVGMIQRGEVGVVVASLGLAAGVFSPRTYALIVAMSLLTAMITPPVLAILLRTNAKDPPDTAGGHGTTTAD